MRLLNHLSFLTILVLTFTYPSQSSGIGANNMSGSNSIDSVELYYQNYKDFIETRPEMALENLYRAYFLTIENPESSLFIEISLELASYYIHHHAYDSTLKYSSAVVALNNQVHPRFLINGLNLAGQSWYFNGAHDKAAEAHLKAIDLISQHGLFELSAKTYIDLANVYIRLGNWAMVEQYLSKAIEKATEYEQDSEYNKASGNLGMVYAMQGKWENSIDVFNRTLRFNKEINNQLAVCKLYNNLGVVYERKGDIPESYEYYNMGLQKAIEIQDNASIAIGYQNVAQALSKLGKYQQALENFEKGIELSTQLGNLDIVRDGLFNLADLYERMGNYKKALKVKTEFIYLNDSLVNLNRLNAISELEIKYETEKKERENLELKNTNLLQEAKIQQQRFQISMISIGVVVLFILVGLGFVIYKQKQQSETQQAMIRLITETQEEERRRVASDLHDSVGSLIASLKMSLQNQQKGSQNGGDQLEILDKLSDDVRKIAHNIMPATLNKYGLVPAIKEEMQNMVSAKGLETYFVDFGMEERINKQNEIHIFRVVQETLQNAVKHSGASRVSVEITNDPKKLNIIVEDNGTGFNTKTISHNFGLKSIASRIAILKGQWNIDSTPGRGTLVNISIPNN
jgi:two-component system NarL family sensor kinase